MDELDKKVREPMNRADLTKLIIFASLILILVFVILLVNLKMQKYDFSGKSFGDIVYTLIVGNVESTERKIAEITYDAKNTVAFGASGDYIIECTKEKITGFDKSGNIKWEDPISMNNPIIKNKGDYALVADMGGKVMVLYLGCNKKWEKKIDASLLNTDVNESGYVVYVHESSEYKSALTVLDPKGNEMMTKGKGENYIINATLSPDSKRLLVNVIDTADIFVNTTFELYDLETISDKAYTSNKKENAIYPSVWFLNDGSIAAVNDTSILYMDKDAKVVWENKFQSKVYSSNIVLGRYPVVAVSGSRNSAVDGTNTQVSILKSDGKERNQYKLDGEIKNIKTDGDQIAINAGRELHFIDSNGKLKFTYSLKKDIVDVYFLYKERAAVLTRDGLTIISISQ